MCVVWCQSEKPGCVPSVIHTELGCAVEGQHAGLAVYFVGLKSIAPVWTARRLDVNFLTRVINCSSRRGAALGSVIQGGIDLGDLASDPAWRCHCVRMNGRCTDGDEVISCHANCEYRKFP